MNAPALLWLVARDLGPDGVSRIAETCEVSRSSVYSWLNGYAVPSLAAAHRLEAEFSIAPRAWVSSEPDKGTAARAENEAAEESSPALRTARARGDRRA